MARGHEVAAVYTQPDRPAGRSKAPRPTPVKEAARESGTTVHAPRTLRDPAVQAELRALGADAFVVVAYGKLLPPEVLAIPRLGVLNVHPSLLPRYRGPSPVQQAVLDGVDETGVTVMLLDEGMDTGPVLSQQRVRLTGDETAGALMARLFDTGARLLADTLEKYARGEIRPQPQDGAQATVTKLLNREDGEIDWSQPADRIARMVRAYDPWPGTHTRWRGQVLKVLAVAPVTASVSPGVPGAPGNVSAGRGGILVATGLGPLRIVRLQLEGKKPATADEFLRGHPDFANATVPS
jgi:methionyl-tRNA formyltransferase